MKDWLALIWFVGFWTVGLPLIILSLFGII